jgi:hypothetical protein
MKLPNGSFKPETYFLKKGGRYDKSSEDASMDDKTFPDIARIIGEQLGTQSYFPGTDPTTGRLILVVYWGTTNAPAAGANLGMDQAQQKSNASPTHLTGYDLGEAIFDQNAQNMTDLRNAALLGYVNSDWGRLSAKLSSVKYQNNLSELELNRYFVVLLAYDCQAFLKEKTKSRKYKELWETRLSISTRNIDFKEALTVMAKEGSGYFGVESDGLQHVPEGQVHIGTLKSLGPLPEK